MRELRIVHEGASSSGFYPENDAGFYEKKNVSQKTEENRK